MKNEDTIREIIEEAVKDKIPSNIIDDLVNVLNNPKLEVSNKESLFKTKEIITEDIKKEIDKEEDWRKKAKKAAKIISLNLDY